MGLTHVEVRLLNSDSHNIYHADFLVDTGAMDSMAPGSELRRIGMKPVGKRTYELASGQLVDFEYGHGELQFLDEVVPSKIIFGPDDSKPILGVIALESAGFIVDPISQTLKKLAALPLKTSVSARVSLVA